MRIKDLQEQGEYIPADEYYSDPDGLDDAVNQALKNVVTKADHLWADVNEQSGELEVFIEYDGLISVAMMQIITQTITEVVPVQFLGVSSGAGPFKIYLHYVMTK